jgi:hypothetical protein
VIPYIRTRTLPHKADAYKIWRLLLSLARALSLFFFFAEHTVGISAAKHNKENVVCEGCMKNIDDHRLEALGTSFHPACFKCTHCSCPLDSRPYRSVTHTHSFLYSIRFALDPRESKCWFALTLLLLAPRSKMTSPFCMRDYKLLFPDDDEVS